MRTQPITTPSDEAAGWHAEAVDPTGWLAAPSASAAGQVADPDRGASTATTTAAAGEDGRPAGRTAERTDRRAVRARRRRRRAHTATRSAPVEGDELGTVGPGRSDRINRAVESGAEAGAELAVDGYRMGRWARLALTVTVLAAAAVVLVSLTVGSTRRTMVDVTVGPGDTLWSIAAQADPDRDPRAVIEEIRQLNDMQGGVLPVGVVLRVPASAG